MLADTCLIMYAVETSNIDAMTGTTCNIPVPPNDCRIWGGGVLEFWRRADGEGLKAMAIFVPTTLEPSIRNSLVLTTYRQHILFSIVECVPWEISSDFEAYSSIRNCVSAYFLRRTGSHPAVLIVAEAGLAGVALDWGGMITLISLGRNVRFYVLPHATLVELGT